MKAKLIILTSVAALSLGLVAIAAAEVKHGTPGNDTLVGTEQPDVIFDRAGNDTITCLGAGDILLGGRGPDTVDGGDGADVIWGGADNDNLSGGAGPDVFLVCNGDYTVIGNDENDIHFGVLGHYVI